MFKTLRMRSALAVGVSAGALLAFSTPALAATDNANSGQGVATVGDVLVTAEKREVSLQDTPIAISAYTEETRQVQGIQSIQDMTNFTPGLTYSTQLDRTNMRGLGRLTNILAADSAVAVYSDNFFTTSTTEAGRDSLFVDRVEVLRGPQGTLYGRNAIGGVINIISRRPTDEFYAETRLMAASYGFTQLEAAVSGPISDNVRFRVGGYWINQTQGYFDNLFNNLPSEGQVRHEYYLEGQLEIDFGENIEWWVKAFTQSWATDRGGPGSLLGTPTLGNYDIALNSPALGLMYNPGFGYSTLGGLNGPVPGSVTGANGLTNNPALTDIRTFSDLPPS